MERHLRRDGNMRPSPRADLIGRGRWNGDKKGDRYRLRSRGKITVICRIAKCALASHLALVVAAQAQVTNASNSEIILGSIPHFANEAAAIAACSPDGVVWADKKTGFFYPKFVSEYGQTADGTYTCYRQAKDADYWSLTPTSDDGHKGREFP